MEIIWFLIVGLVAGWLAGVLVKGGGYGLVGDIVVGILGARDDAAERLLEIAETAKSGNAGDLAPEGLLFIPAADSPNGKALLVTANEVSGSTTLYTVADDGKLNALGRHQVTPYTYDKGAAEIPAYDRASKRLFVVNGAAGGLPVLAELAPKLTMPVLILQGENDGNIDPAYARKLKTLLPDSTLKLYPGLGHSLGKAPDITQDNFAPMETAPMNDMAQWMKRLK